MRDPAAVAPPLPVSSPEWRVLFVDDEKQILSGLRNVFRRQRKQWSMTFLDDPREAVERLKSEPFDVVISDMRMPQLDGAQLLAEARRLQPEAVRFVLSGHGDLDSSLRAANVAHQYFTKPCRPESLKTAIEAVLNLRRSIHDARAWRTVGSLYQLPVSPRVFGQLQEAINRGAEPTELAPIIEADPGLTAKVLQTVNSSFFRLRREVTRVEEAVVYLGVSLVRSLVLATEVFNAESSPIPGVDPLEVAHRSLKVAAIAQSLLPPSDRKGRDEAFTAGLLHDVGLLVLAACCPDDLRRVHGLIVERGYGYIQAEHEVLGETHAAIGAYQLGLWGLPHRVVEAVALHHTPVAIPEHGQLDPVTALQLAHLLLEKLEGNLGSDSFDLSRLQEEEDSAVLRLARGALEQLPPGLVP